MIRVADASMPCAIGLPGAENMTRILAQKPVRLRHHGIHDRGIESGKRLLRSDRGVGRVGAGSRAQCLEAGVVAIEMACCRLDQSIEKHLSAVVEHGMPSLQANLRNTRHLRAGATDRRSQ